MLKLAVKQIGPLSQSGSGTNLQARFEYIESYRVSANSPAGKGRGGEPLDVCVFFALRLRMITVYTVAT